jgi:2-dehydropantoate 2-reductase
MRILFLGAGAIGTYIGGSLALGGHPVAFIERPAAVPGLQTQGLRLQLTTGEHHITNAAFYDSPAAALAAGPYDFAVFALKAFDTAAAIAALQAVTTAPPPILCLQNGVENEVELARAFGAERVIPGTVTTAVGKPGVGHIVVEKQRGIGIARGHSLSPAIVAALNTAGLRAQLFPNAAAMKWSKLLTNLVGNALAAILDLPARAIFADPALFAVEMGVLRECLAVMRGLNISPVDLPRTPVRWLAFGAERVPAALARPLMARFIGGGRGGKMPSFHIDLHRGRGQTEVAWLHGAVARHGRECGMPTPLCAKLTDLLIALSTGQRPLTEFRHQSRLLRAVLSG